MAGSVTMVVKIAPNGEVNAADAASNSGLSDSVVKCIARALKNAQFDPPGSSGLDPSSRRRNSSSNSSSPFERDSCR